MTVTKREVILSISMFLILTAIAIAITLSVVDNTKAQNEVYHKALKLSDEVAIQHAKDTAAGLAFIEVELRPVDNEVVSFPDLVNSYQYVQQIYERYVQKTRTVTYTDGNGKTKTRTETYWVWDVIDRTSKEVTAVKLNDMQLLSTDISVSSSRLSLNSSTCRVSCRNDYVYEGNNKRYSYRVIEFNKLYSAFVNFEGGDVKPYQGRTISLSSYSLSQLYDDYTSRGYLWLILVWFLWAALTAGSIVGFYYLENHWLNKD